MKPNSNPFFSIARLTSVSVITIAAGITSGWADTITGTGWKGTAGDSNWSSATNWDAAAVNNSGSGDRNLFFGQGYKLAGGTGSVTATNDLTGWAGYRITFQDSNAAGNGTDGTSANDTAFTINGNGFTLFDFGASNFPKIENLSYLTQTFSLTSGQIITLNGGSGNNKAEINAVNGNLTFSAGTKIDLAGTTQLQIYGNNAKTLTFNDVISSTGNSGNNSVAINQNSIVVYGAANTYGGDTFVNAGRLEMASGSSIANSQIQLGDTGGAVAAEFRLTANGGYNFNRNITVRSGSSQSHTINSTNTTGTNTLGGTVTLNAANSSIKVSSGGTLNFTNVIAGTGGIIFGGGGTINLSSAGSYTTSAGTYFTVDSGTLNIAAPVTVAPTYRMNVGWNNASPGILNVTNTTFTMNSSVEMNVGGNYNGSFSGTGIINIGGTALNPALFTTGTTMSNFTLGVITSATGSGTINLNAFGTLATLRPMISKGLANSALFNFDGGTFRLTGAQSNMIDAAVVTTIKGGGATIDTNNFNGTLNSALLAGTGSGGVTKIGTGTLTLRGASTYTGATAVRNGTLALGSGNDRLPIGTTLTLGDGTTSTNGIFKLDSRSQALAGLLTVGSGTGSSVVNGNAVAAILTLNISSGTNTFGGLLGGLGGNENNFGLTKSGLGILELTNANTYTGVTSLGGGTLKLSGGNNRLLSTGAVTFTAASTLDVGSTSQTLSALTLLGAGQTNTISGSGGTLILNVPDTTWNTTVTGTTVNMSGLSNFTLNRTAGGFQLNANGLNVENTINLAKAGTNTINVTNARFGGGGNFTGQNVLVGLGQANNINASTEFVIGYFNGNGNVSFQSGLTDPILTVRGASGLGATPLMTVGSTNSGTQSSIGILNLTGGSLNAQATTFNVASHFAGVSGAGTSSTGTVTMPAGTVVATTLNLAVKSNTAGTPTLTGTFNQGGGTVTADTVYLGNNANGELPNLIANYNLTGGELFATTITGNGATYGGSTVRNLTVNGGTLRNLAGGNLTVNGVANTTTGRINIIAGASGATFNADASRTITLGANTLLDGAGAITKSGNGTLLLNGTSSSYTGTLSVDAGTLGGEISLGGNVTVGASGKLAPGASTGTIGTIATKGTTWTGGSIWEFDLSAGTPGSSDLLSIDGNFTKGGSGTYQFNFMNSSPTVWGATYTLVSWTGTNGFSLGDFSYTNLGGTYDGQPGTGFSFSGNSLTFTAVPEPSSALAGLLITAGLMHRRRK